MYKIYRLRLAANGIRKGISSKIDLVVRLKILNFSMLFVDEIQPHECGHLVQPDPALERITSESTTLRCRTCRRILASQCNMLTHSPGIQCVELTTYDDHTGILVDQSKALADNGLKVATCSRMHFMEPMQWMVGVLESKKEKLHCPKCSTKLGGFCWDVGISCPCGTQVSPAFYAIPSKVETIRCIKR